MKCIECKADNLDDNRYCGQCGAELGRTLDETVRKRGFRDRQATEMEIAESVASRLMKWAGWLGGIAALILASFGAAIGLVYHSTNAAADAGKKQIESAVMTGKTNINSAVTQATRDITTVQQNIESLRSQADQLRSEISGYKEVNAEMETLQKQFHGQTADLSKLDLRVHTLETIGTGGPSSVSLARLGCPPSALAKGDAVAYCAQGSPPFLFQRTSSGDLRPVSSSSPIGFQDLSSGAKPACTPTSRGTFFVEKRIGKEADKPFICAKQSDNTYSWIQLATSLAK